MTDPQRPKPPLNADERTNLEGWLDFYRATLDVKCRGLTDEQVREAAVPPSGLTLLGLVQHMAEVERNWYQRVLTGADVPPLYGASDSPGHSGGFELRADASFDEARSVLQEEVARSRANCATHALEDTAALMGGEVSLRWIHTHMIAEYARHDGHADLLRERIDGSTGV